MTVTVTPQQRASDPTASAWVSANAGSGKTYVLTQRVKRLLLAGVTPSRILCLTFTKAAAANMSNRVLQDLAGWVGLSDAALAADLARLENRPAQAVSAGDLARARRVFAAALETPGGLKIQTIHAFCDALLHQFPFEAGVAAGFQVMDDAKARALRTECRDAVLRRAAAGAANELGDALRLLAIRTGESGFADLVDQLVDRRQAVLAAMPSDEDGPRLAQRLRRLLDVPPGVTAADVDRRTMGEARLDIARFAEAAEALDRYGSKTDRDCAERLRAVIGATDEAGRRDAYAAVFRTGEGKIRSPRSICTKAIETAAPWLADALRADLARLEALDVLAKSLMTVEVSLALLRVARAIIADMEEIKRERGLLDFADLVTRTNGLLEGDRAAWVRWKLDRGIEHVLVDEAQDTSDEQWAVIRALTDEFFAGEGAVRAPRTVFAVGDEKQSIFSFQGAAPQRFADERRRVEQAATGAGLPFWPVSLTTSFRSAGDILAAVDEVFARPEASAGLVAGGDVPPHEAARRDLPGHVELWPLVEKPETVDPEAWTHAFDDLGESHPAPVLARRIAAAIREAVGRVPVRERDGRTRPLRAGDVMILVRRRNGLFEEIIRALKFGGIPVAGADRLVLLEHIAVMDLIALAECMLMPDDDLTLATVLKSPLLGLDEDDLYTLAQGRSGALMATLARRADERPRWREALDRLEQWRGRADRLRPYEFFSRILGADGGRRAFVGRLGREANDALDEFLSQALAFEQSGIPTLRGFIRHMRDAAVDVKREMDQGRDEVRVMTVHNSKGLEAKFVILPDTTGLPGAGHGKPLHEVTDAEGPLLLWSPSKKTDPPAVASVRAAAEAADLEEYRRLLYVALTRAEERLLVCGVPDGRRNEPAETCWYSLVTAALLPNAAPVVDAQGRTTAWIWRRGPEPATPAPDAAVATSPMLPAWARAAAPPAPDLPAVLSPSRALDDDRTPRGRGDAGLDARLRGEVLHRLLQSLPEVPPARRAETARAFVERRAPGMGEAWAAEALAVLTDPAFAPFLGEALAEVPVLGDVILPDGRSVRISGRIDRLVVTEAGIAILDYKTGAAPAAVPAAYVAQLALYGLALRRIWPGRPITAHLVWTRGPRLDTFDEARLWSALGDL